MSTMTRPLGETARHAGRTRSEGLPPQAAASVVPVTPRDFRNVKDYHWAVTLQVSGQAATVVRISAAQAAHVSAPEPQR